MAALTLTQARTQVLDDLDDPNGRRFNIAGDFARVDRALQAALSGCLSDADAAGCDHFDEEVEVTTSTAGLATLTVLALAVRGVQVSTGGSFYPVQKAIRRDRQTLDQAARTLKIEFVRDFVLPADPAHPLVGVADVAGPTWRAFDDWVCAEAALRLGIMDNDRRPGLEKLAAQRRASALGRTNNNDGRGMPDDLCDNEWAASLGYIFTPSSTSPTVQMVNLRGAW